MLALIILDGWGHREEKEANAIALAKKPNWDALLQQSTHLLVSGSGRCVGLPDGQIGNSEVGHLNIGAGRIVYQDLTRIDQAIADNSFFRNPVLLKTIQQTIAKNKALHIFGLISPGGVHSHQNHILALLTLAAKEKASHVFVHAFLDGRDTPPKSAYDSLQKIQNHCENLHCGKIASLIGRYYAMDRDKRWERVEVAYDLLTQGKTDYRADDALSALEMAYARGETDEFIKPTSIHLAEEPAITVNEGDAIIFMNYRADRARELTHAFIDKDFSGFSREKWPQTDFVTLTEYDANFNVPVVFAKQSLDHILAEELSRAGLRQLRIAETEKYAHVTFFFNGGVETPFAGEDRVLIPSPKVATYDLQPEMSAYLVTERLVKEIKAKHYDFILCNFANPDMVGHTGDLPATIKAIEVIDECLGKIMTAIKEVNGEMLITADHGNAECMFDPKTGQPHTAHTQELVPLLYLGRPATIANPAAKLSDIAPTILYLLGLPIPQAMTGQCIFKVYDQ